ncbi:hypothetical protein BP6252_02629 [Coleophoma cylindrospora]|uniref:Uncharacterized protein n=1 Tax=Coleophoma cylindrospora TaxID=1849047 RepID=A0A3D8SFE1_9HELO|nr:hypothetical protein BP6252_02629 [Coleophoma cylindrospora]
MESSASLALAKNQTALPTNQSYRPRANSHAGIIRKASSMRNMANENRAPSTLSSGLESMLKTTTETGDIGLFSIKASYLPPPLNTPRRTGRTYSKGMQQIPGRQTNAQRSLSDFVDDRKRLPSYKRDASSEVFSMYEDTIERSSNPHKSGESDHRSYSMTQTTSVSSYALTNHKSYTSLRSQAESNNVRPKSPFTYPSRLKRPGFRPSSPALNNEGLKDYTRRAEIERPSFDDRHNSASPASFYSRKRVPQPLGIRPELDQPNALNRASPTRRATSPLQRSVTPANDFGRRSDPVSNATSPARSTYSLASTVNLYISTRAPSTATTPGKIPPSPLYYDYTEEFDNERLKDKRVLEPPPAFQIVKSIPEDRPLSSSGPTVICKLPGDGYAASNVNASPFSATPTSSANFQHKDLAVKPRTKKDEEVKDTLPRMYGEPASTSVIEFTAAQDIIRTPNASNSTPQLDTEIGRTFALTLSSSDTAGVIPGINSDTTSESDEYKTDLEKIASSPPISLSRNPSIRVSSTLKLFPTPPGYLNQAQGVQVPREDNGDLDWNTGIAAANMGQANLTGSPEETVRVNVVTKTSADSKNAEEKDTPAGPAAIICGQKTTNEPSVLSTTLQGTGANQESLRPEVIPYFSTSFTAPDFHFDNNSGELQISLVTGAKDLPKFPRQAPKKSASRSGTPMLAPKPISPARQAKLKNSVPQLMKALPPLPSDMQHKFVLPPNEVLKPAGRLPFQIPRKEFAANKSHLVREARLSPHTQGPEDMMPTGDFHDCSKRPLLPIEHQSTEMHHSTFSKINKDKSMTSKDPLLGLTPKMKPVLKSSALRPVSPSDSRPWNLEESYPWSNHDPALRLPSLVLAENPLNSKPPKFKLKVTRASNSTLGTVRVHRTSTDSKMGNGFQLRQTKDLFTPAADGLENIFRKVSRNLTVRRTSLASTTQSTNSEVMLRSSTPDLPPTTIERSSNLEVLLPQASTRSLASPFSPTEVRSFFSDDSSHQGGGHSLRKRLSNFRARMGAPYYSRAMSQSLDDNAFRQLPTGQPSSFPLSNTALDVQRKPRHHRHSAGTRVQARKLKTKVSKWLKGAQLAFRRAKSRARK